MQRRRASRSSRGQATVEAVALVVSVALTATAALAGAGTDRRDDRAARDVLAAASAAPAAVESLPVASVAGVTAGPAGAPLAVAERLLALGIREVPDGSDGGPAIAVFTDGRREPWCADFVSFVLREGGRPFTGGASGGWRIPWTPDVRDWFRARGRYASREVARPLPGDIVYFHHGHVGIVRRLLGETLETIEGNASNAVRARAYPRWRQNGDIGGFGRP